MGTRCRRRPRWFSHLRAYDDDAITTTKVSAPEPARRRLLAGAGALRRPPAQFWADQLSCRVCSGSGLLEVRTFASNRPWTPGPHFKVWPRPGPGRSSTKKEEGYGWEG